MTLEQDPPKPFGTMPELAGSNGAHPLILDIRNVIDGMSEGFALLDSDFTILDVNAETMRLESRTRDEIIGKSHWDAYPGTEHSELGTLFKKALRERVPVSLEHHHVWDDGRASWLDMRAFPIAGGRLAIFFRDVTERHETERKLRESEARFRGAVDAFADALWTNDPDGKMTGEQPGWAALTGQSFHEYQGYGWSSAVHPDDAQPTIDAWQIAVSTRQPFVFEHRVRTRDGTWRRFAIRAVPVLEPDGSVREWVGVHRDITATTEARLQLARNAETFQTLVRNNPFGIYVIDSAFQLLHVSQGCGKVFNGIEPLLGRDFAEILRIIWQDAFAEEVIGHFRHTLATGETYISHRTVETRRNIEAVEAYDWRIDRIVLPDGQFGVVCYFYDLSERVALETSLREALSDKDLLIREIDHRVRNSMTLVSALLSMQGNASSVPEIKHALSVAAARMQAVARVHERLYKGKEIGVVDFDQYLTEICDDLRASMAHDRVTLETHVVPLQIAVDHAIPLGLVTTELVTNAFKHCVGNGVTIKVTLERYDRGYTLTIDDDGVGMPEAFEAGAGTGLGMRVISMLTKQVGATLHLPQAGEAARFQMLIPAEVPESAKADEAKRARN